MEIIKLLIDALGALLIPIVLVFMTRWFTTRKEIIDRAKWESDQIATFIEHLSSNNKQEKKLALLALNHLKESGHFPYTLLQAINSVATESDPTLAAQALIVLGEGGSAGGLSENDRRLVDEVLYPIVIHFGRTKKAFNGWIKTKSNKPNEYIESVIRDSNLAIKQLLYEKWHLIPQDYIEYASQLVEHYNAWLQEYEDLRPNGVRDPGVRFVFVGPKGYPFPDDAEDKFIKLYNKLTGVKQANK
jgi:hypothetical protein